MAPGPKDQRSQPLVTPAIHAAGTPASRAAVPAVAGSYFRSISRTAATTSLPLTIA